MKDYLNTPKLLGKWIQAEPSGCDTKCGVGEGLSGTPGAVTCSTTSCDPNTKPDAKQCPATEDCGTFGSGMSIVNSHSHHHLATITNNHHKLPPINQYMHSRSFSFVPILIGNWLQKEPSECAKKCGVGEGLSGTPGEVTCDSLGCNPDTKPNPKQCPATVDCGTFDTDMVIVNRHSPHLLRLHHHHSQPSHNPCQSILITQRP